MGFIRFLIVILPLWFIFFLLIREWKKEVWPRRKIIGAVMAIGLGAAALTAAAVVLITFFGGP